MRLHRLELSAFGPYPGIERVDFDALAADRLFLLHGDTGAGKTTLLDAVAFALFGSVPGARGEAKRLRCDLAAADTPTEVTLELTVTGTRLRLHRSPEYQRPKKRGDGTTTQHAKASLTWLDGSGREPLTRAEEVGAAVKGLLGLNAEQFFQVVLLPQGEFAKFLRADTSEREQLLTRLFATGRFGDVERWFRERRVERAHRRDELRNHVEHAVAMVAHAAGAEPPGRPVGADWLAGVRADANRAVEAEQAAYESAAVADSRAQDRLAAAKARSEKVRRVAAAETELATLSKSAELRQSWEQEVTAAQAASPVAVAVFRSRESDERLRAARAAADATLRAVAGGDRDSSERAGTRPAELRRSAGECRQRAGALGTLVAAAAAQHDDERRLVELSEEIRETTARSEELAAVLRALPERREAALAGVESARQAIARTDGLLQRRRELARVHEAAARLPEAEAEVTSTREAHARAVDAQQHARDAVLALRARRLEGMAAELAGRLTEGAACPVCGSREHPEPARHTAGAVGADEEQRAADEEETAQRARDGAAAALRAAEERLAAVTAVTGGTTADDIGRALHTATAQHESNADVAAGLDSWQRLLDEVDREQSAAREREQECMAAMAAAKSASASISERVAGRADELERARGSYPDVAARRDHLLERADVLDRAAEAVAAVDVASQRCDEHRAAVDAALTTAGFPDVDTALAAARSDDALARLREDIAGYDRRRIAATTTLEDPELAGVRGDEKIDLTAMTAGAKAAREAAESALVRARAAERRRAEVAELGDRLCAAWRALEPVEVEYAELDALTDVVNGRGQNEKRISLRSYVLAARLEEVAAAATHRLRAVSGGRYSFEHSDSRGARGTRGGLGIEVRDDYSGVLRSTKTLSGGESFLASLALALGLADVVSGETGAAQLDTLFIDEGFGSLDADTLEAVLDALDELRAGGRVVGVVSHVEEMRQRIPMRLRVHKARAGSTVSVSSGSGGAFVP